MSEFKDPRLGSRLAIYLQLYIYNSIMFTNFQSYTKASKFLITFCKKKKTSHSKLLVLLYMWSLPFLTYLNPNFTRFPSPPELNTSVWTLYRHSCTTFVYTRCSFNTQLRNWRVFGCPRYADPLPRQHQYASATTCTPRNQLSDRRFYFKRQHNT